MSRLQGKVAVVTGANRGIGKAIAQRLAEEGAAVVLAVRDPASGEEARREIGGPAAGEHHVLRCDLGDDDSVSDFGRELESVHPSGVHVLVNNAGILDDRHDDSLTIDLDKFRRHLDVNVTGALRVCRAVIPLLRKAGGGNVVNVSSTMGQFEGGLDGGYTGYRVSKAALNALTKTMAYDLKDTPIRVNVMHPGWVRSRMGGADAPEGPEDAAETALMLATLPPDGPTGRFWRSQRQIAW